MKITDIDKNLRTNNTITAENVRWIRSTDKAFALYGAYGDDPYTRMPQETADKTNEGVAYLNRNTAGIRLRFRTDSPFIAIHSEWAEQCRFPHMPVTGVSGFDLYRKNGDMQEFVGSFQPPFDCPTGYESIIYTFGGEWDYILYFPLYNHVDKLYIGIDENSKLKEAGKYARRKPVVYYGSSITQGGCASRPGNAYQAMISRALDMDFINLGFSASAKGEQTIAEYIATLPMSVFVLDYDHNAPTPEHLEKTHYPFYKTIRSAQKELPVIMLSKPDIFLPDPNAAAAFDERMRIVKSTYEKAVAGGDKNVYFINGGDIFGNDPLRSCTVDNCHPNDLGFYRFYEALCPLIKKITG